MQSGFDALAQLSVRSAALFLDFDGTLAELVDRPGDVSVRARDLAVLAELAVQLDGALAIVSGREIAALDRFFAPHVFTASGVHGFEMRFGGGAIEQIAADDVALERIGEAFSDFARQHSGVLVETKPASIALHWRQRPELEVQCQTLAAAVLQDGLLKDAPGLRIMHGKMVVEIKAHGGDKGQAIAQFMARAPFRARRPIFIGDDVTDESAFAVVNALAGVSIKVGAGATSARFQLADPAAVHGWLEQFSSAHNGGAQSDGGTH